ncbi:MAG: Smr/MutS family protein [Longimicrobiaceae bacterium]
MARRRRPRGEPPGSVHPLLDLHGLTADEARRRAEGWLRARAAAGERTVVVVTGRGTHSRGLPVLRPEIEHLLHDLQGTAVHGWETTPDGGGFRVTLRPPPALSTPAAAEAASLRRHPPELRRRAEESLAELGITPTPALLNAEIRRLLDEDG